jgi:two-component system KDP operon response regulator KdpE
MDEKAVRVLVVDDERPIRRFLNASLSGQYTVLEAATGEEALAVTVSGRPDVIILDLGLPDLDGIEVTRRLREWTQIPIIVVSVRDREEDKIAALDAGAWWATCRSLASRKSPAGSFSIGHIRSWQWPCWWRPR